MHCAIIHDTDIYIYIYIYVSYSLAVIYLPGTKLRGESGIDSYSTTSMYILAFSFLLSLAHLPAIYLSTSHA